MGNTAIEVVQVKVADEDCCGNAVVTSILTSLGIPLIHASGWLSYESSSRRNMEAVENLSNWLNVIYHHLPPAERSSLKTDTQKPHCTRSITTGSFSTGAGCDEIKLWD